MPHNLIEHMVPIPLSRREARTLRYTDMKFRPMICNMCVAQVLSHRLINCSTITTIKEVSCCSLCKIIKGRCHKRGCSRQCTDPDTCGGCHGRRYTSLIMTGLIPLMTKDLITGDRDTVVDELDKERGSTHHNHRTVRGPTPWFSKTTDSKMCEGFLSVYDFHRQQLSDGCTIMR